MTLKVNARVYYPVRQKVYKNTDVDASLYTKFVRAPLRKLACEDVTTDEYRCACFGSNSTFQTSLVVSESNDIINGAPHSVNAVLEICCDLSHFILTQFPLPCL